MIVENRIVEKEAGGWAKSGPGRNKGLAREPAISRYKGKGQGSIGDRR